MCTVFFHFRLSDGLNGIPLQYNVPLERETYNCSTLRKACYALCFLLFAGMKIGSRIMLVQSMVEILLEGAIK